MPCSAAVLQGVGVQAIIIEYLIVNVDSLFVDASQTGSADVTAGLLGYI